METRARDLVWEVHQDPDSDRYLFFSEKVFDNAADDLEIIAVPKRSMSLFPQMEAGRVDLKPYKQDAKSMAKIWCVKMEDDAHRHDELSSHLRVMRKYLKARYILLN